MLTPRRLKFAREYAKCLNASEAARRAGYAEESCGAEGFRLLQNAEITEAIEDAKDELLAREMLTPDWVLAQWKKIAAADPGELCQMKRGPCEFCWPDERKEIYGVLGFDFKDACPECGRCKGDGIEIPFFADTRKLKGNAKKLYAGVEVSKTGIKIKMRDQDSALRNIASYMGMLKTQTELSGPGGGPVVTASANVEDYTDDQLKAIIERASLSPVSEE